MKSELLQSVAIDLVEFLQDKQGKRMADLFQTLNSIARRQQNRICFIDRALTIVLFVCIAVGGMSAIAEDITSPITLEVNGEVTIIENDKPRQLKPRERLKVEKLTFGAKASLLVVLPEAERLERLTVDGDHSVSVVLSGKGAAETDGLKITRIPAKLTPNMLANLPRNSKGAAGRARAVGGPPHPTIKPASGSTVLSNSPTFAWPSTDDVEKYEIRILAGNIVEFKHTTTDSTLDSPEDLERGTTYEWEVTAILSDKSRVEVVTLDDMPKFYVANEKLVDEVVGLARLIENSPREKKAILELVAMRYEELDLIGEAIDAYEQLNVLDPNSAATHAALYWLYTRAGNTADAKQARNVAEKLGHEFVEGTTTF